MARAIGAGKASRGGSPSWGPSERGGGAASTRSRSAARSASVVRRWCVGALHRSGEFVGEELDDVLDVVNAVRGSKPSTDFEQGTPDQAAGPVPAESADVFALAMPVAGFDDESVERRPMLGWHPGANCRDVGLGDVEPFAGVEQRRQLQGGHLGEGGAVEVVAGDGSPLVQLEPCVDRGVGVAVECTDVVDRRERRRREAVASPRGSDRTQHDRGLDGAW